MITATIEIAAPPSVVRDLVRRDLIRCQQGYTKSTSKFLDFPTISIWHTSFIQSIESKTPGKPTGHHLKPGDRLQSRISGMQVDQTVEENSLTEFRWIGPWYGILTGVHAFCFQPSSITPNGTTFVQWEEFSGLLAWYVWPGMPGGKQTFTHFEEFNLDLKARAESIVNGKGAAK